MSRYLKEWKILYFEQNLSGALFSIKAQYAGFDWKTLCLHTCMVQFVFMLSKVVLKYSKFWTLSISEHCNLNLKLILDKMAYNILLWFESMIMKIRKNP